MLNLCYLPSYFFKFQCRFSFSIPKNKLIAKYSRSSGPGGQSVNKSETKVQLRFHVDSADWLDDEIKRNFKIIFKNKISSKGDFIVSSDTYSSRFDNYENCIKQIDQSVETAKNYKPKENITFLEQINKTKSAQQILNYKLRRKEERLKMKKYKKLKDFY